MYSQVPQGQTDATLLSRADRGSQVHKIAILV